MTVSTSPTTVTTTVNRKTVVSKSDGTVIVTKPKVAMVTRAPKAIVRAKANNTTVVGLVNSVSVTTQTFTERFAVPCDFRFHYFSTRGPRVGFERSRNPLVGNNENSFASLTAANMNDMDTWPKLVLGTKVIPCYPFNHSYIRGRVDWGYSQDDPCMLTDGLKNRFIYIQVESNVGIVKATHNINDVDGPWNDRTLNIEIIGQFSSTGYPIIYANELGYVHRETTTQPNPHFLTLEKLLNRDKRNRFVLSTGDKLRGDYVIRLEIGSADERDVGALLLNGYKQLRPPLKVIGGLEIEPSYSQASGALYYMRSTTGKRYKVQLDDASGIPNFTFIGA